MRSPITMSDAATSRVTFAFLLFCSAALFWLVDPLLGMHLAVWIAVSVCIIAIGDVCKNCHSIYDRKRNRS